MRPKSWHTNFILWLAASVVALACLAVPGLGIQTGKKPTPVSATKGMTFATPEKAVDALIDAAEKFDVAALERILGPGSHDIVQTEDVARDREQARTFATLAREKHHVSVEKTKGIRAFLILGNDDWPFPVPIVKRNGQWSFDAAAGRREVLLRRIGRNELDIIELCRGYVEAQHEYALKKRDGYEVNQYAQRIISSPGKQDGLAWQNSDGTWGGPVGENVARAIERGYTNKKEPFHGYFMKVLKGQGPSAPMGQMDFVLKGLMIGGFALVASPAQYGITGVKTFIVSQDGVVYEKDLGPNTLTIFAKMDRFDPDKTWSPVGEQ